MKGSTVGTLLLLADLILDCVLVALGVHDHNVALIVIGIASIMLALCYWLVEGRKQ